jgi:predicted ATP-grasp superfamily ATP-dependent carboligase
MTKVLILDGFWRKSLSALRSLQSANLICIVESDEILSATFVSHLTKGRIKTTKKNRWKKINQFLENEFHKSKGEKTILIPMEDMTMKWVIENQRYLKKYADFLVPSLESYLIADDKLTLMDFAECLNIPHPKSYKFSMDLFENSLFMTDGGILETKSQWVVKPRISSGSRGVVFIDGSSYLNYDFALHESKYGELLVQQRIPRDGTTVGVCLLYNAEHSCILEFSYERVYEYPITGGPSTQRISMKNDELINRSIRILDALNWTGVAMIEWKFDDRANDFLLLEINPRFWGSLDLSYKAGVNFPEAYVQTLIGNNSLQTDAFKVGVKSRWLIPGDLLRYLSTKRRNREGIKKFLKGALSESEEFSSKDLLGSFASILFPILLACRPKYWKFLRR